MPENGINVFKPIVGVIHGYALGAGYNLGVRCCDITIAGESALLGYPESRAGIAIRPLEYTPHMQLKLSLDFALMAWKGGQLIATERALQIGLVHSFVPDAALTAAARRRHQPMVDVPPLYLGPGKRGG